MAGLNWHHRPRRACSNQWSNPRQRDRMSGCPLWFYPLNTPSARLVSRVNWSSVFRGLPTDGSATGNLVTRITFAVDCGGNTLL